MENSGISSAGTSEVANNSPALDPTAQPLYYQPTYNTTNDYGAVNAYDRNQGSQNFLDDTLASFSLSQYGELVNPASAATNLHAPAPHPNYWNIPNYAVSLLAPQAPNQMFTSSDQDRGSGSMPLTSPRSLDQYLTTPQSHLLQLRGTNPPVQPPHTNNFHAYGMPDRPQRFSAFNALPYCTDPTLTRAVDGHSLDEESSHINRKKRKACGRCGPCQRKDNCGACMNCVNRAKGKQICIYRKCEELKKKPGTESYATTATSDHQIEAAVNVRRDKRKELEQSFSDQKRTRTEDPVETLSQQAIPLHQKFTSAYTSNSPNFSSQQHSGPTRTIPSAQPYSTSLPGNSTAHQHQLPQTNPSPHTSGSPFPDSQTSAVYQSVGTTESSHTTDIISEALREIENDNSESNELSATLNQGVTSLDDTQSEQNCQRWSRSLQNPNASLSQLRNLSHLKNQLQLQGTVRLPGQPPPLPPGTESAQKVNQFKPQPSTELRILPEQLLGGLTSYEFGSFRRTTSAQGQLNNCKQSPGAQCPYYENISASVQSQAFSAQVSNSAATVQSPATTLSLSSLNNLQPTVSTNLISTSTPGSMYHNDSSMTYGSTYSQDSGMQYMVSQPTNPHSASRPNQPSDSTVQPGSLPYYHDPNPQGMFSNSCSTQQGSNFRMNLVHQSSEFVQKLNAKQPTLAKQSTSVPSMSGSANFASHLVQPVGQDYYSQQFSAQKWGNAASTTTQSNIPVATNVGKECENMSPKAVNNALLSPACTFLKESSSHSQMISQMPELAPSPVGATDNISANSEAATQISSQTPKNYGTRKTFAQTAQGQLPQGTFTSQQFLYNAFPDASMGENLNTNKYGILGLNATGNRTDPSGETVQCQFSARVSGTMTTSSQSTLLARLSQQSDGFSSNAPVMPTTSQSETNLTISPGESGYDSAEIVHIIEDNASQKSSSTGSSVNHPNEVENVSVSEKSSFESSGTINENVPKNLHRASVDSKAGSTHNTNLVAASRLISHIEAGLPSTEACDSKNFEQFNINTTNTPLKHAQATVSKRSYSYDSAPHSQVETNPVQLRRYSNQEMSTTPNISSQLSESHFKSLSSQYMKKTLPVSARFHQCPGDGTPNHYTFSSAQKRNVPFETPPVTPSSAVTRQPSNDTASDSGVSTPKIADILPTPPHATETSFTKLGCEQFSSHRGFKVQTSDNSPMKTEFVSCNCIEDGRSEDAPYYTHLGAAESVQGIRRLFEKRTGYSGSAIRIEKVIYTGKEGKTSKGCPMAKWIIRRSGEEEKILIVCRRRPGHKCATAIIVVIILLWDGVARPLADFSYESIINYVPKHGEPTERRCATNDERTCACQGFDDSTCGASFSFGCSWSMYYNGCKYARSTNPNKYKLSGTKDPDAEKFVGKLCERLATVMSPLYEMAAPDAFYNQVEFEAKGSECRLGEFTKSNSRPFSGVTSCLDFCAHSHKDQHNMDNGSTVVVTFTKPEMRTIGGKHSDEQLHVLPLCKLDISNEQGNFQGVAEKISSGAIEILQCYQHESRLRNKPKLSKKQKMRAKKKVLEATTDSPPYKRRGRPPKRSRSSDNLNENSKLKIWNDDCPKMYQQRSYLTPPKAQRFTSPPTGHRPLHMQPPFYGPMSPTRWPYRKHVPPYSFEGTAHSENSNAQNPGIQRPPAPASASLLDNLPSIGNFFYQNFQGADGQIGSLEHHPPQINSPSHLDSTRAITPVYPSSPFPPTADVLTHSTQQNLASFEPRPTKMPDQFGVLQSDSAPGTPQHNPSINLKEYAAQNAANFVPEIGQSNQQKFLSGGGDEFASQIASASFNPKETVNYSDSEENFLDSDIGGVAVAPGHGSVLIECAKKELHATTAVHQPNRFYPSRISLVFYQHKSMNARNHGAAEYEAKEEERRKQKEEKKAEEMLVKAQDNSVYSGMVPPRSLPPGFEIKSREEQISLGQCQPVASAPSTQLWNPGLSSSSDRVAVPFSLPNMRQGMHPVEQDSLFRFGLQSLPCISTQSMRDQMGNATNSNSFVMRTPLAMQHRVQENSPWPVQSGGWPQSIFQSHERFATPHVQSTGRMYSHMNDAFSQRYISALPRHEQQNSLPVPNPMQNMVHPVSRAYGSYTNANYIRPTSPHVAQMQTQRSSPLSTVYTAQIGQQMGRFPTYPTEHFTVGARPRAEIYSTSIPGHAVSYQPETYHEQQFPMRYMNPRM